MPNSKNIVMPELSGESKLVDGKGRVVIPLKFRQLLKFNKGEEVFVYVTQDGAILINREPLAAEN